MNARGAAVAATAVIALGVTAGTAHLDDTPDQTPKPQLASVSLRHPQAPDWVTVINWAQTKLGTPYVWGGESDAEGGFDCSGLMLVAFRQAGIDLPRVAKDQYHASDVHPAKSNLRPGDMVFYSQDGAKGIHHVGLYLGSGMMIHAPNSRSVVRFNKIDYMDDYFGATRVTKD